MTLPRPEERSLLERCRRGDPEAFTALYSAYQDRAYGTAFLICRDRALAADAVQEAFVRVYTSMPRFQPERPFRPWFYQILTHETLRLLSRRKRFALFSGTPPEQASPEPTPELISLDRERAEEVWRAICELPEAGRSAVVLRYYAGLSEEEMAQVLAVPEGTVKSRLSRAREHLRRMLPVMWKEERTHA